MEKLIIKNFIEQKKERGYMYLADISERTTKNGSLYCALTLKDGKNEILGNLWESSLERLSAAGITSGMVVDVSIDPNVFNGKMNCTVSQIIKPDDTCTLTPADFIKAAPYKGKDMLKEILRLVNANAPEKADDECSLIDLVNLMYKKYENELLVWSAAKSVHHNYMSGLLYHIFRMCRNASVIKKVYATLNEEILLSAVALHDIGKLKELVTDDVGGADYSIDGDLFGHTYIGLCMVDEALRELPHPVPSEKIKMLKHCIASHHGFKEFGAIEVPHTKEAYALHSLDMLDSRMDAFEQEYSKLEQGAMSQERIFALGTKVYNPMI